MNLSISTSIFPGESRKSKKDLTAADAADRGAALAAPAVQPSVPSEVEVPRPWVLGVGEFALEKTW